MKLHKLSAWFSALVLLSLSANCWLILLIRQVHHDSVHFQQARFEEFVMTGGNHQETEQLMQTLRPYTISAEAVPQRAVMEQTGRRLDHYAVLSLGCLGATAALVLLALHVIRRQVLQPISQLGAAAGRLAGGVNAIRVNTAHPAVAELAALGATFDAMAQAVEGDKLAHGAVQRQLKAARRLAADATRANAMCLDQMNHAIRMPLNAIICMNDLALNAGLAPRAHDYVGKMQQAAKSLRSSLDDILDFSHIGAGKLRLEQARFKLEDVVDNALAQRRNDAHDKRIELLLGMGDPDLLGATGELRGDPQRLEQVLANLLSNAIKFTHSGYVCLSVDIESRVATALMLRFVVSDSGGGMSPEQVALLFHERTPADGATTLRHGGAGLGLAIAKKLIELMDGQIWVESMPGIGSRFIFTTRFALAQPVCGDDLM